MPERSDGGGFRADCEDCDALDGSTHYTLFAERDLDADRHERETGHDVERTPHSPELLTDGGEDDGEVNRLTQIREPHKHDAEETVIVETPYGKALTCSECMGQIAENRHGEGWVKL